MATKKHYFQFFNKLLVLIVVALSFCIVACSGADGKDGIAGADGRDGRDGLAGTNGKDGTPGVDGKDGAPGANGKDAVVNLDSLADAIRKEISGSLWDSVKTAPNIDTVYKNLFDQAFGEAWMDSTRQAIIDSLYAESYMDSVNGDLFEKAFGKEWMDSVRQTLIDSLYGESYVDSAYKSRFDSAFSEAWIDSTRQALLDSLKQADYDSLYTKLYDSVYNDIYTQSVIRTLYAEELEKFSKENIYGAFANQYPMMYEDFSYLTEDGDTSSIPMPFPIAIANLCDSLAHLCNHKKIMLKSWIQGFSDTSTITQVIDSDTAIILSPMFSFNEDMLFALKSPQKVQRHVEVYALENDRKILFYSTSKTITIHPPQVFGTLEEAFTFDIHQSQPILKNYWYSVFVTPNADSISAMVGEIAQKLPNGELLVYQQYSADASVAQSLERVAKAVFEVLQSRNIKYVEETNAASIGQRINYPVETLRKKQGICIETTVLFASILERLGFDVRLILIPGHAFVGWAIEQEGNVLDFVETTMIGDKNSTFAQANESGTEKFSEQKNLGNFESGKASIVMINYARLVGIMPNNIP